MQNGDKQVHKFVMQMKNMDKIEATYTRKLKENYGRDIALTVKKGGKKMVQYSNQFTPSFTATHYILDVQSQFDLSKDSKTYDFFCNYGCFTKRTMKSNIKILKAKPYKIDMQTTLTKDKENVLEFVVNTVNNPYKFILKAPRLLPKILPTGRKSIEFTADHQPGKHLSDRLQHQRAQLVLRGEDAQRHEEGHPQRQGAGAGLVRPGLQLNHPDHQAAQRHGGHHHRLVEV